MFIFPFFVLVALDPQHSNRSWVLRDQAPSSMNRLWTVSGVNWTKSSVDWISMALHRKPVAPAGNKWAEAETELVAMLPVTTRSTSNSWALVRALLWISALLADHWLTSQVCKEILCNVGFWCQTIHKKWLWKVAQNIFFLIPRWPFDLLLPGAKKSAQKGWIGLAG